MRKGLKQIHLLSPGSVGLLILGLEALAGIATYLAGGTQFALTHLMYIPILLAAYFLDLWGAVFFSVAGGLILGPRMPMNVSTGLEQTVSECVFRACIFLLVGVIAGLLFQLMKADTAEQIHIPLLEAKTGLSNLNKLRREISVLAHRKQAFSMLAFRIANLLDINACVDYSIGEKSVSYVAEKLEFAFGRSNVFMASMDTYIVLLPGTALDHANARAVQTAGALASPVKIGGFAVRMEVQCAALYAPSCGGSPDKLLEKLKIALDRSQANGQTLVVFHDAMIQQNRKQFEILTALYTAIENHEFFMVYQPIIHIANHKIRGVEGLLRWNHANFHMGPGEFIGIAEKAGFISEITKWVIQHSIRQIRMWQDAGVPARIAVNISSKDLNDDSVLSYTQACMQTDSIPPQSLGFELTERVIMENEAKMKTLLDQMQDMGMGISIDDFGTGYNSLVQLVTLPITYLKIDKFFVDRIENKNHRAVIRETIQLAHSLKIEVIAEGVETEAQLRLLEKMGCDNVQGYYFSKPLTAEEYVKFSVGYL